MIARGMTEKEAAYTWVQTFNAIPTSMIQKLMEVDPEGWMEQTYPAEGDRVVFYLPPIERKDRTIYRGAEQGGKIVSAVDEERYIVRLDDGAEVFADEEDFADARYNRLPMWGAMWQFCDACDNDWIGTTDGLRTMSDCGFRIYEHDEWGWFFGIDGAGYDFFDEHWIPLYRKRGLRWHDVVTEKS